MTNSDPDPILHFNLPDMAHRKAWQARPGTDGAPGADILLSQQPTIFPAWNKTASSFAVPPDLASGERKQPAGYLYSRRARVCPAQLQAGQSAEMARG